MEELLLWRWSTAVQISSALLVAVFFLVFGRSSGRSELRWWVAAWVANGIALLVTWAFWFWQPSEFPSRLMLVAYLSSKSLFVVLILLGTQEFIRPGSAARWLRPAVLAVLLLAVTGGVLGIGLNAIGTLQASTIAVLLAAAALLCWRAPAQGLGWLAIGLALRALLALAEAGGYGWRLFGDGEALPAMVNVFLAVHSSFDTGAEWVIALGCVLAITQRIHAELARGHAELGRAHAELRDAAERDPLTGLYNRRMLPTLLDLAALRGGELLFFDLDDFKRINDADGHEVGDACLRRFALALRGQFTDALALVRFAGDEFLAILPDSARAGLPARLDALRTSLSAPEPGVPPLQFSVGVSSVAPGRDIHDALHEADLAMYRDKAARRAAR
jgi:diguanylate cyclase (GGDEF)-like protein